MILLMLSHAPFPQMKTETKATLWHEYTSFSLYDEKYFWIISIITHPNGYALNQDQYK